MDRFTHFLFLFLGESEYLQFTFMICVQINFYMFGMITNKYEKEKRMAEVYGYVRVSTKEQKEDRQMIAMRERGIKKKNIYVDKQSGKDFNRPMYQKLLKKMKENDVLFVKALTVWAEIMMKY